MIIKNLFVNETGIGIGESARSEACSYCISLSEEWQVVLLVSSVLEPVFSGIVHQSCCIIYSRSYRYNELI